MSDQDEEATAGGQSERFEMRISPDLLEAIDAYRRTQPDIPSRSKAIRRLIEPLAAALLAVQEMPEPEAEANDNNA